MYWGPLTLQRHRELLEAGISLRVFVDGVDVTDRCYYADDRADSCCAYLFKRDEDGQAYLDPDTREVATEIVQGAGKVRMRSVARA